MLVTNLPLCKIRRPQPARPALSAQNPDRLKPAGRGRILTIEFYSAFFNSIFRLKLQRSLTTGDSEPIWQFDRPSPAVAI